MNTIIIEILRNGQTVNQLLQKELNYIALCGPEVAKDFMIKCDQEIFDDHIKLLRYDTDESSRQLGIAFFQELITGIIDQIYPAELAKVLKKDFLHLRLVTTPKEIAQLPFEMALTPKELQNTPDRKPFFINDDIKTTFTREVRHVYFDHYNWPVKPRILFAWARPGDDVPHIGHADAFSEVLRPWALPMKKVKEQVVPDIEKMITTIANATPGMIKSEISRAVDNNEPYTHIHLLAHGMRNPDETGEQFLLVLNNDDKTKRLFAADASDLAASLIVEKDGCRFIPQVVTLAACDSGNTGSPVNPVGSLAHGLHNAGIPCVFASQLPLTQDGSVKLVKSLYKKLLESSDPRLALYNTRVGLKEDGNHDWASLVAYARFPEDIDEQMKDVHLKIILEFMKTSNGLADHVIRYMNQIKPEDIKNYFNEVSKRLDDSIKELTDLLENSKNDKVNKLRFAEQYGLMGSAYKRKAEHIFRTTLFDKSITESIINESKQALTNAMNSYQKGYKYMNSHWTGSQYLSLAAVLNGTLADEETQDIWLLCRILATADEKTSDVNDESLAWAYGTLAELFLLKPLTGTMQREEKDKSFSKAKEYLRKLNQLKGQQFQFPKESTARQIERYINWWPKMFQSEAVEQLESAAKELRQELPSLEELMQ
jgi:hypothetical protein